MQQLGWEYDGHRYSRIDDVMGRIARDRAWQTGQVNRQEPKSGSQAQIPPKAPEVKKISKGQSGRVVRAIEPRLQCLRLFWDCFV